MSLKRSGRAELPPGLVRPDQIEVLETLQVFGVRADYMAQFREFLEQKGLSGNDSRGELFLPLFRDLGRQPLKTIRVKREINGIPTASGDAFRQLGPLPVVEPPAPQSEPATDWLRKNRVTVNWYPKVGSLGPDGDGGAPEQALHQAVFTPRHVAFMNLDRLQFELERFRTEREWHHLGVSRDAIRRLLDDRTWYCLQIPADQMALKSFGQVELWEEVALALLKKYLPLPEATVGVASPRIRPAGGDGSELSVGGPRVGRSGIWLSSANRGVEVRDCRKAE
jgi:hypothetical protein